MELPLDISVVFMPLVGAAVSGLLCRRIGDVQAQLLTCLCVIGAALGSLILFVNVAFGGYSVDRVLLDWISSGGLNASWGIKIDTLSAVMLLVVNVVSAMVHIYSVGYMRGDKSVPRFMSYLGVFTFFMSMLVTAPNLLQMFFGWEGVGLSSYLLIGFWIEKDSACAASIKAFLVNRVGDFGFLLGIFGCFALLGSLSFGDMFAKIGDVASTQWSVLGHNILALDVVCLLLFIGAMGKSAQIGLHTWLPDAMEGPTPVSALIHAATMVTAGVFMLARLSPLFEHAELARDVVTIVGAVTCVFAAAIGLTQFDIKRVIAYSTISQLGYMFFAAGVSAYSAAIFHLMTHAFFKALLFLCAGSVIHAMSGEQDMRKMGGLLRKTPVTYGLMLIGSLAIAGIGLDGVFGFAGFYSKDLILESAIAHGGLGTFAYYAGLLAAFMTAFYSWRLLILTFHGTSRADEHVMDHAHESPFVMLAPLAVLALGALFAGSLAFDWFAGAGADNFWRGAVVVASGHADGGAHHVAGIYRHLPLVAAVLGIVFAYIFYVAVPALPAILSTAFGFIYKAVCDKFYFDEIYDALFVRPAKRLGGFLWKKGDDALIDGYGPDGIAALASRLARRFSAAESGYVYHYAFAMIIGLAVFVSWFLVRG